MEALKNMTLAQIAGAVDGTYFGAEEEKTKAVTGVVIDSRQVEPGFLFIAIKGERVDGHSFIPAVFEKGAACVLSERTLEQPAGPYILVTSCEIALKRLAAYYRRQLDIRVVGITGSVGKTSTKEMIASVLSQKYQVLKTAGNYNNEIGLPLTIFRIRARHQIAVLEMGISDFGEMHRLAEMAQPDICAITNIGLCHLENLGTRNGIFQAKTEVFAHMKAGGLAVLNGNDDKLAKVEEVCGRPPVFYGIATETDEPIGENGCHLSVYADHISNVGLEGMKAVLHLGETEFEVHIPIAGEHHVMNALCAAAIGKELGLTPEEIRQGIAAVETLSGHSNVIHTADMTILDDCYNANPVSMKAALRVLAQAKGRKIAVLGDMGELGTDEAALHYSVGKAAAEWKIDTCFGAGTLIQEAKQALIDSGVACELQFFDTVEALIPALLQYKKPGDTILVKASHFMGFSKIVKALTED